MKAQKPSISPLPQRIIKDMQMRKLGDRTQERYRLIHDIFIAYNIGRQALSL